MAQRRFPALAVALVLAAAPAAPAAPANARPPAPDNAALLYWQAMAQLPPRDKKQDKILTEWHSVPLDADALKLIEAGGNSLKYLHRGTAIPKCDWGMPIDEGMGLVMPQLAKGRDLARLASLRARHRFQQGDSGGAVEDVTDALVLGRHIGSPPIPISLLVGYLVENAAIDAAAPNLGRLDAAALKRLGEKLDALPPAAPLADSVWFEQEFGQRWLVREVQAHAGKEDWARQAFAMLFVPQEDPGQQAVLQDAIKAVSGTPQGVIEQLEALGPFYEEAPKALSLPPEQARTAMAALHERFKPNPFAKLVLPAYDKINDTHARASARLAMLKAAVAIAAGGAEKVKESRDPYGSGPFEYRAMPEGFELKSKLTVQGKPVTLTVGGKQAG